MVIISRAVEQAGSTLYKITGESSKPERVFEMQPIQVQQHLNGVMEWWIEEPGAYKLHYHESSRGIWITEYFIVFRGDTVEDGLYASQDDISGIINHLRKLRRDKAERKWEKRLRKITQGGTRENKTVA